MLCDHCGKDCEELVTRQGFLMTYFVEWVCSDCFRVLENVEFEDYGRFGDDELQAKTGD